MLEYIKLFFNWLEASPEIIGFIASFLVFTSMLAKTTSYKGTMFMRIFNTLGSIAFVIYGASFPDKVNPVVIMNTLIIVLNIVQMIREYESHILTKKLV